MAAFFGGGGYHQGMGGLGGGSRLPQTFDEEYNCYSFAFQDKTHLEGSDKIFLPPSALDTLARLHIDYPMLFQLTCRVSGKKTHCGVLEFSAAEGSCYLPYWMMQNLMLEEGGFLQVKNVSLPKCTFVKLRPQSVDFLEITNPRAVLERALRSFSCVTVGDQICIPHNEKFYHIEIRDVKPADAACIIETDCDVDFEAPVGYVEPGRNGGGREGGVAASTTSGGMITSRPLSGKGGYKEEHEAAAAAAAEMKKQASFSGRGARLDGKAHAGGEGEGGEGLDGGDSMDVSGEGGGGGGGEEGPTSPPVFLGRTISGRASLSMTEGRGSSLISQTGGGSISSSLRASSSVSYGSSSSSSLSSSTAAAGAAAGAGGYKKPGALDNKYSSKKGFRSFAGPGNKLA
ncbi:hypothetical protein VYU27_009150 [Nannochloropsis oceanica]